MKRCKLFLLGFLLGALIFGSISVFADAIEIKAFLSDIKLSLNGQTIDLKEANGEKIMPIAYNGTTYLPVKPIALALGMEVNWNSKTNTVEILNSNQNGGQAMVNEINTDNMLPKPSINYYKEGNLDITYFIKEDKKYVTPGTIITSMYWDYKYIIDMPAIINEEGNAVTFNKDKMPIIENYPVIHKSGNLYVIPYDDYKNDLLPKLLKALKTE